MRRGYSHLFPLISVLLLCSTISYGQSWAGILSPARAVDWTQAGLPGGIPSRTTICANVLTSDNTAAIQSKINGCPANQVVQFPTGTWNLSGNIFANKGIVLRGSGPTNTLINLNGGDIFLGSFGTGGLGGYPNNLGSTNWTGGLTRGSKVLTLASTAGVVAGQRIILDQHNAPYVFTLAVEGECIAGNSCGRNDCTQAVDPNHPNGSNCPGGTTLQTWGSDNRAQLEIVEIQSVDSPTQITIKAPGASHDYSLARVPQAFYWNTSGGGNIEYAGVENMKINANGNNDAISMPWCDYCWVRNVAIINIARAAVLFQWSINDEVRNSYFASSNTSGAPTEYGKEMLNTSFAKVENNIFYGVTSNILPETTYGLVAGYNYTLNTATGSQFGSIEPHLSHNYLQLYEGNVVDEIMYDNSWGSSSQNTSFRNRLSGNSPNKTNYRSALKVNSQNHYMNIVGNVLGDPTFHTRYRCDNLDTTPTDKFVYDLGFWNSCEAGIDANNPYDTVTESSLMRWGNWDAVTWKANGNTDGVRYCTGSGTGSDGSNAGNSACTSSETASTDPTFPGLASPSTTLPASFYLAAKPSWFNSVNGTTNVTWPPIGP